MPAKIDKTRPYASICGDDQGRVFEQDHKFFGADGNEWTDYSEPAAKAPAAPPAAATVIEPTVAPAKLGAPKAPAKAPAKADKAPAVPDTDAQLSAQLEGGAQE